MKPDYTIHRTFELADGTIVSQTFHGPGEFSSMSFSPKAQAVLKDIEIKGVQFRNSVVKK